MKARTWIALLAGAALSGLQLQAVTPDKFVRYVEATGSQYVDTGIVGRYGTKTECKVEWMAFSDSSFLACGDWSGNKRFFLCHCSNASGQMFLGYRTGNNVHKDYDLLFEKRRVYTYTTDISALDGDGNATVTVTIWEDKSRSCSVLGGLAEGGRHRRRHQSADDRCQSGYCRRYEYHAEPIRLRI